MDIVEKMASVPHVKMPEFHGDPIRFPGETWKSYRNKLELIYLGSGTQDKMTDKQRVAHMLQGLKGKAAKFLDLNPDLVDKSAKELNQIMEKRFGKASVSSLLDMAGIVQKPSESIMEFVARLRSAGEYIKEEQRDVKIVTKEQLEEMDAETLRKQKVWTQEQYENEMAIHKEVLDKYLLPFFLRGLRPELKSVIIHKNPPTLEIAIQEAETHERYAEAFGSFAQMGINTLDGEILEEAAQQLKTLNSNNPPPFIHKQETVKKQEDRTCFNCGKRGHLKRDCRQLRPPMTKPTNGSKSSSVQSGVRDMRQQGAEGDRPPPGRDRGEYRERNSNFQRRGVNFEKERNSNFQSRNGKFEKDGAPQNKYRNPPAKESSNKFQSRRSDYTEQEAKNGGRPPRRGGLTLPSPLRREPMRNHQNKEPSRH